MMIRRVVTAPLTLACQRSDEKIEEFGRLHFSLEPYAATASTREPIFPRTTVWVNHIKRVASFWTNLIMTVGPLCTGSCHVIRIVVLGVACLVGLGAIAAAVKKSAPPPAPEVVMPVVAGNKADRLPFAIRLDMPTAVETVDVAYVRAGEE